MKKLVLSIICTLGIIIGLNVNVKATYVEAEKVFNKNDVTQMKKEIDAMNVYEDKNKRKDGKLVQVGKDFEVYKKNNKKPSMYPNRKGVILVTADAYKNLIPTGHAAIIYSPKKVVESLKSGVQMGKNNWYSKHKTCYAVTTYKTSPAMDAYVADWCYSQIGKDYNWNYFNVDTRKKFYCSQLVWAGYLDKEMINLNTKKFGKAIHPMELVNTPKTYMIYKQK